MTTASPRSFPAQAWCVIDRGAATGPRRWAASPSAATREEELAAVAERYPVFRIVYAGEGRPTR